MVLALLASLEVMGQSMKPSSPTGSHSSRWGKMASSSLRVRHFRPLFFGFTDSAVLTIMGVTGVGKGEDRGCLFTSLSCFFTLSCAILNDLSSNCFSHAAFSVFSLILLVSSRARLARARRQRSDGSLFAEVAVAAVAASKISCWELPASFETAGVREETTHVCSSGDAPLTSFQKSRDGFAKVLIMVIVLVVVSIKAVVLGDDVCPVRTEGFGIATLHVLALRVALPAVQTFPCLLAGCVDP